MLRWYLNSEHAVFQLRMEDSRKGRRDEEKELSTPNPHVDWEKGKKTIVYNTKEGERKEGLKVFSNHSIRACPRILFRLAFSPTLYKFIVWATWVWIHSCSGFKSNLVLTVLIILVSTIITRWIFSIIYIYICWN